MKPMCEACERLALENDQLRDAVTIWQKLADERRAQIDAQSERLVALSEKQEPVPISEVSVTMSTVLNTPCLNCGKRPLDMIQGGDNYPKTRFPGE